MWSSLIFDSDLRKTSTPSSKFRFPMYALVFIACLSTAWAQRIQTAGVQPTVQDFTTVQEVVQRQQAQLFVKNEGQWPSHVRYLAKIGGMNAWITDEGITYDLHKPVAAKKTGADLSQKNTAFPDKAEKGAAAYRGYAFKLKWSQANPKAVLSGKDQSTAYHNYFIGKDPAKWRSNVPLYSEVMLEEVYKGVDVRYYFDKGLLRYDYNLAPGADVNQIRCKFDGVKKSTVNADGSLALSTPLGQVEHQQLFAYQEVNGAKKQVPCSFTRKNDGSLGFKVGSYDRSSKLVIDPIVWSTFIGGSSEDIAHNLVRDDTGYVYITGHTASTNYPTTAGVVYTSNQGGLSDAFVSKLNATGTSLLFSTYFGGANGADFGEAIKHNPSTQNLFVGGYTYSTNFPTTGGVFQTTKGTGGFGDGFVMKLSTDGKALRYSSFLGGNGDDGVYDLYADQNDTVYVCGVTFASDFPMQNPLDNSYVSGEGFVTKINPNATALLFSTYIGGSGGDGCAAIHVDAKKNIYVGGTTSSNNFTTTGGVITTSYTGGADAFLLKLNYNGSARFYSTYLGKSLDEEVLAIASDDAGNCYITGRTSSTDFYRTDCAFQQSYGGGTYDGFVAKVNSGATAFLYSTFLGGNDIEYPNSIVADVYGNAIVAGYTKSSDFPTVTGSEDVTYGGSSLNDAFVTVINPEGCALLYSTYLGGSNDDGCNGVVIDGSNNAYVAGSGENGYPTTSGAYDETNNGVDDVVVTKLDYDAHFATVTSAATGAGWRFIYVPAMDVDMSPSHLVGDDIAGLSSVFEYDGSSYNAVSTLEYGRGYYVFIGSSSTLDMNGVTSEHPVCHKLYSGWNIIANPFDATLTLSTQVSFTDGNTVKNLSDAKTAGWVSSHPTSLPVWVEGSNAWLHADISGLSIIYTP